MGILLNKKYQRTRVLEFFINEPANSIVNNRKNALKTINVLLGITKTEYNSYKEVCFFSNALGENDLTKKYNLYSHYHCNIYGRMLLRRFLTKIISVNPELTYIVYDDGFAFTWGSVTPNFATHEDTVKLFERLKIKLEFFNITNDRIGVKLAQHRLVNAFINHKF